ncbi:MAG: hypothetical protein HYX85_00775 [Chloroflexi bacterium]|nr:hypothetical protein [Chloroflexota bacterium]
MLERTFPIAPVPSGPFLFLGGIGLLLLVVIGLLVLTGYYMKNARFGIEEQGLRIRASLYSRFIPREQIVTAGARVLNLNSDTEYLPRLKTNGTGLPCYSEGWFRLRNNERALLFVTDRARVVYLPTNQDYSILLSVSKPDDFLQAIRLWR